MVAESERQALLSCSMPWLARALAALLVCIAVCSVPGSAWAAEVSARLYLDAQRATVGQEVGLRVRVAGGNSTAVPKLAVPDGLGLRYVGASDASRWVNGRSLRYRDYLYRVQALESGSYQLGPAAVEFGTTKFQTNAVKLQIAAASDTRASSNLAAEVAFSPESAYVGQVVLFSRAFRTRVAVDREGWPDFPMDGLSPRRAAAFGRMST